MRVLIENLQSSFEYTQDMEKLIENSVSQSMALEGFEVPAEISILLVDNVRIHQINLEHRGVDRPTDVLSFPLVEMKEGVILSNEGDFDLDENMLLLGDIVLSLEMAQSQAVEYGHSLQREVAFLVTHGVFHLLGYDHMEPEEEKRMLQKQEDVLKRMGLPRQ